MPLTTVLDGLDPESGWDEFRSDRTINSINESNF